MLTVNWSDTIGWITCHSRFLVRQHDIISSDSSNGQEFLQSFFFCISTLLSYGQCLNTHVLFGTTSNGITVTNENKKRSADADKPARRVWRSVKVTKHSTIPYVRYSFLLCNSNFVFKTRRFYDIRLQKISWPWNGVKNHSRSLRVVSFDRLCMVSH